MTAFEGAEGALLPAALVATTVNVYEVPFVSPVKLVLVAAAPTDFVAPPGEAVRTKPIIALPPFDAGGDHVTVARALPAVAATFVGESGTVLGVMALDWVDG